MTRGEGKQKIIIKQKLKRTAELGWAGCVGCWWEPKTTALHWHKHAVATLAKYMKSMFWMYLKKNCIVLVVCLCICLQDNSKRREIKSRERERHSNSLTRHSSTSVHSHATDMHTRLQLRCDSSMGAKSARASSVEAITVIVDDTIHCSLLFSLSLSVFALLLLWFYLWCVVLFHGHSLSTFSFSNTWAAYIASIHSRYGKCIYFRRDMMLTHTICWSFTRWESHVSYILLFFFFFFTMKF